MPENIPLEQLGTLVTKIQNAAGTVCEDRRRAAQCDCSGKVKRATEAAGAALDNLRDAHKQTMGGFQEKITQYNTEAGENAKETE